MNALQKSSESRRSSVEPPQVKEYNITQTSPELIHQYDIMQTSPESTLEYKITQIHSRRSRTMSLPLADGYAIPQISPEFNSQSPPSLRGVRPPLWSSSSSASTQETDFLMGSTQPPESTQEPGQTHSAQPLDSALPETLVNSKGPSDDRAGGEESMPSQPLVAGSFPGSDQLVAIKQESPRSMEAQQLLGNITSPLKGLVEYLYLSKIIY